MIHVRQLFFNIISLVNLVNMQLHFFRYILCCCKPMPVPHLLCSTISYMHVVLYICVLFPSLVTCQVVLTLKFASVTVELDSINKEINSDISVIKSRTMKQATG
jgi:hypothetical protein